MDINRGGSPDDIAYASRGFKCVNGEYVYENYRVDKLIDNKIAPIEEVLKIPGEINGIRINCIAKRAFENETKIVKIILPESIREIGESAFADCINLSEIQIPSEYVSIGNNAFKNTAFYCEHKTTYLNNTLMKVDPSFSGVLKIDKGTTSIADNALQGCSELEEVIFPSELITIRDLYEPSHCGECEFGFYLEKKASVGSGLQIPLLQSRAVQLSIIIKNLNFQKIFLSV